MMTKTLARLLTAALGLALIGGAALAKTRECLGEYVLLATPMTPSEEEPGAEIVLSSFAATGECRAANRCRERAREAILKCAAAHRHAPTQTPLACTPSARVQYYSERDLGDLWEKGVLIACCDAPFGPENTVWKDIRMVVRSHGDTGCGHGEWKQPGGSSTTKTEALAWGPAPNFNCALVADRCPKLNW